VPITNPTPRTTVKRRAQRGVYEHATILRILDEGLVCHMGFVVDGQPFVLPTAYARIDDHLYLHGSPSNRMLRTGKSGLGLCVTVTLLDGLVLARSAFHHSMNYRSVVLLGKATVVDDLVEKRAAFRALVEHVVPGRYAGVRAPSDDEITGTLVLRLPITEGSAKVRSGPPIDDEGDYAWPVWAGVIPLGLRPGAPVPDPRLDPEHAIPTYAAAYTRE
jgi:nitroimidazol reductase NimA-like FMN-containing flavoprotein (pyridoxamine 5'-phosphate oxidase superfamily)